MDKTDLNNIATEHAINALENQIKTIANAYIKGYEDGMNSFKKEHFTDEYDTFVDLGLKSGTMWTSAPHRISPQSYGEVGYYEAEKLGIPTIEQFKEMYFTCKGASEFVFFGPTLESIKFDFEGNENLTWIKCQPINDGALAYKFTPDGMPQIVRVCVEKKLRILRVKCRS